MPPAVTASVPPPGAGVPCPQCGHVNAGNRFCASCGYNLGALGGASSSVPAPAAAPATPVGAGIILTALRADGSEAGTFRMPDAPVVTVGRDTGSIFAGDSYLSPRHATFSKRGGQLFVKDEASLNGVYLKVRPNEPCLLEFGDVFRIGQEIIRFEELRGQGKSPDGVDRFGKPWRRTLDLPAGTVRALYVLLPVPEDSAGGRHEAVVTVTVHRRRQTHSARPTAT
jgi:pSer/pThr/pTyr-binding forkhead associated (FHA) protein